ncbi:MAG: DUF4249 family protein [Bacteroidota bacterium]
MRFSLLALLAVALGSLASCDTYDNDPYRDLIVVEAVMQALEPVPPVFLSTTIPIDQEFTPQTARRVNDATVVLQRLDEAGGVLEEVPYENTAEVGRYDPVIGVGFPTPRVVPLARYRLLVDVPSFDPVRAETIVPDTFTTVIPPISPATYQGEGEQPTVTVTPSAFPGRQTVYIFSILAVDQEDDPDPTMLTPFARSIYDNFDEDDEDDRRDFLQESVFGSSPLLNEAGYTVNPDGTRAVPVPWVAFSYYGFHELSASAVDDALLLFLSTQAAQFTPTTLSPGEIPNITTNVQGGLGVFGSYARSTTTVTITPD